MSNQIHTSMTDKKERNATRTANATEQITKKDIAATGFSPPMEGVPLQEAFTQLYEQLNQNKKDTDQKLYELEKKIERITDVFEKLKEVKNFVTEGIINTFRKNF